LHLLPLWGINRIALIEASVNIVVGVGLDAEAVFSLLCH
jgi:hypothetical protein